MQTSPGVTLNYTCFNLPGALEFLGNRQGVLDLLPVLCTTLSKDVPEVANLLLQGKVAEAGQRLHSLKGFVPVFCFPSLHEELVRVERLSKSGASVELTAGYAALGPALQRLGEEAAHFRAQAAPAA